MTQAEYGFMIIKRIIASADGRMSLGQKDDSHFYFAEKMHVATNVNTDGYLPDSHLKHLPGIWLPSGVSSITKATVLFRPASFQITPADDKKNDGGGISDASKIGKNRSTNTLSHTSVISIIIQPKGSV
jgi:hypothetical protein